MKKIARQALYDETIRRGWTFEELGERELYFRVTLPDGRSSIGRGGRFMSSSANGSNIANVKDTTYDLLESFGYKVPAYLRHETNEASLEFLRQHGTIVVKPADSSKSRGVTANVRTPEQLERAIADAVKYSPLKRVILQEQLEGQLYRILVIGGKLCAAAYRRAAYVTGDGASTIEELIVQKNLDPRRAPSKLSPLVQIDAAEAQEFLGDDFTSVLADGEEREVVGIASVSRGGEAVECTAAVHPELTRQLEAIARELHISVCGYDVIMDDVSNYDPSGVLPVLELNSMPGFKLHLYPTGGGEVRDPSAAILDYEFGLGDYAK